MFLREQVTPQFSRDGLTQDLHHRRGPPGATGNWCSPEGPFRRVSPKEFMGKSSENAEACSRDELG